MMHHNRSYSVRVVNSVEELVDLLNHHTWCECNAFKLGDLTLANDSTSADGAQEYAVIRDGQQIESLTVSWMKPEELANSITSIINQPEKYSWYSNKIGTFDHPQGPCIYCA